MEVEHEDDVKMLQRIAAEALPIAERIFGKDNVHYHVFSSSLQDLQGKRYDENGKVNTGMRYNPETLNTSICMLKVHNTCAFQSIAKVRYLPSVRYLCGLLKNAVGRLRVL